MGNMKANPAYEIHLVAYPESLPLSLIGMLKAKILSTQS